MSNLCLRCGYSVTEPICASCAINEIKVWLYEQKIKAPIAKKIKDNLKLLLNQISSLDYIVLPSSNPWKLSIMECIRCKNEMHLTCFYCVNSQASQIIKDNLKDKALIESFQESFNMEIYAIT